MANPFFDLHCHPIFKSFISLYEHDLPTKRKYEELKKPFVLSSKIANKIDDWVLHILQSQSALDQCEKGNMIMAIAAIASLEFGFADSKGFLSNILKSSFTEPMDKKYFDLVKQGKVSYYRLLIKEIDLYRKVVEESKGKVSFLSRKTNQNLDELQGINILLGLEGGHNLSRMLIGQTLNIDNAEDKFDKEDPLADDFLKNAHLGINPGESIKCLHEVLWKNDMDILYLTLTHLSHISEHFLATHAFGMKMLKHASFFPSGNGISALGRDLVEACYKMKHDEKKTPILIDIKHMGLKSRQDLYQLRKEKEEYSTIPLLASHIGVTGYSTKEWKDALKKDKCKLYNFEGVRTVEIQMERKRCGEWGSFVNNEFTFNPWSINMMDDDIIEVLESDGLIGMSLDVRVLGFQAKIGLNNDDQSEYVSTADFQTHFPYIGLLTLPGDKLESMASAAESWLFPTKEERHPLCLCFNIVHIVTVGKLRTNIEDPWSHICIGSDFDGLIEPLKICQDTGSSEDLRYNLLKWLPVAAKAYEKENGGVQLFPSDPKKQIAELKKVVDGILYNNGKRFIQKWFNASNPE